MLRSLCKGVCLIVIPVITFCMTVVSLFKSNNYLVVNIMPIFLVLWFGAWLISIIGTFAMNLKRHEQIDAKKVIFYAVSLSFFLWCGFVELFSRSILLGGFHAL